MRSPRTRTTDRSPDGPPSSRRWWHISGVSHATVVAYVALFMAMSGTAVAATGGTFILGKGNTADSVSTLTNSAGPALTLRSPAGTAPLQVNRNVKVTNLNADMLDGIDSTGFVRLGVTNTGARTSLTNPDGVPLRLTPKAGSAPLQVGSTVKVTNLNADLLDGKDSTEFVPRAAFDALVARVSELEARQAQPDSALAERVAELEALLAGVTRETVDGHDTVRFSDVNVQIVNGTGTTDRAPNGRGNLILGYNRQPSGGVETRPGSHYLVVGDAHQWTKTGGIVAGFANSATGAGASVLGGQGNSAGGSYSSVSGGSGNRALGDGAAVTGGESNRALGHHATVSGGRGNTADLYLNDGNDGFFCATSCGHTSVSGGFDNIARGPYASVTGGRGNLATGWMASVSGGSKNTASGEESSILGGSGRTATGVASCHPACS